MLPARTRVKRVTTPKKSTKAPVARKYSPTLAPRVTTHRKGDQGKEGRQSITKAERNSIIECNNRVEDQQQAEMLRSYLNKEFPDVLKEQLERENRMNVDPAELVMVNKDVDPH